MATIERVRIGNDIKLMWQILNGGVPVNLTNATDIKVSIAQGGTPSCDKIEITTFEIIDAVNGMIAVEVQKEVITELGYLWAVLEYTVPDSGMIDGNRKVTVDNVPVRIVAVTDEASQNYDFTISSDILAGFQGKSAYEVWLVENPGKTKEDYYNWLQKPAIDIAETVGLQEQARVEAEELRVEAEQDRQTNTQEAILNAENATENANNAATNADDAREAIQDDLALKANHGYASIEVAKTLKEVEDNASVKIENLVPGGKLIIVTSFAHNTGIKIDVINGNKYYTKRLYQTISGTDGTATGRIVTLNPTHDFIRSIDSSWVSTYSEATEIQKNLYMYGPQTGTDTIGEFSDVMIINLTATFGAGNEPTNEEFELLLATLGIDYFEGEITIPAQKIMQWQLALIRKNKNAIIALGGTII